MSPPPAASASLQPAADLEGLLGAPRPGVANPPARTGMIEKDGLLSAAPSVERPLLGIGMILLSTLFFAASDAFGKMLTATLPAVEVAWIRYLVFVSLVVPGALLLRGPEVFAARRPGLQVVRGFGMVGSSLLFILSLRQLQVADATATNFVAPIFITALSVLILGERVGVRRWTATAVGLVGVLIVVRPGADILHSAALLPMAAAFIWALAAIATRVMAGSDRPETTLVYSAIVGFTVLSAFMPSTFVMPTRTEMLVGVVFGATSTIGHVFVVQGFRHGSASVLAPFSYAQLVWATAFGWLLFGVFPTIWTLVGGAIIAASGLYIAHREHVRARDAKVTSV
ncbi:DMT family transporter [Prosthecomicrobium sp. N25]|uniref:DMT family transporter n=1 Tax=Prosthecomicrobium sp. N25 TaxID=3129254 RepID=UPI003077C09F